MRGVIFGPTQRLGVAFAAAVVLGFGPAGPPSPTLLSVSAAVPEVTPSELEVVWDGQPREVVGVEPPGPWRLLVYVDAPLATAQGLRRAVKLLAERSERLTGLGEVELVVADPVPRQLLLPTADPDLLRRALRAVLDECASAGELLWLRQRFEDSPLRDAAAISEAERAESGLRERQNRALGRWLSAHSATSRKLLVLVRDGYDLRPSDFYRRGTESPPLPDTLALRSHAELERRVAGAGWTTLALTLGDDPTELSGAREALERLASASGGAVVGSGSALRRKLGELGRRRQIVFAAAAERPADPRELSVRRRGQRRPLPTARWLALPDADGARSETESSVVSARPVLRLIAPGDGPLSGTVRVHSIVSTRALDRVEFLLDGEPVGEAEREPFSVRFDLGDGRAVNRRLTAVAYGLDGRELGADSLLLNPSRRAPGVRFARLEQDPYAGELEVAVDVTAPPKNSVVAVDFHFNDGLIETVEAPPWESRLPAQRIAPGDYVRVVARLADGSQIETARLAPAAGPSDQVDVNLVEVYAVVTDRKGEPREDLGRGDFHLRRRGRPQSIEGFFLARELPLHLGLVIDSSSSMSSWLPEVRQAAARFLERVVGPSDRAFLVNFSDRPRLVEPPTSDVPTLLRRLGGLQAHGDTVLYDSVLFSLRQFEGVRGRKALVVLTDGVDEGSRFGSKRCIREAREAGVPIYLIRIGNPLPAHAAPLAMVNHQLTRSTGGRLHRLPRGGEIDSAYEQIEAELRSHYLLTFSTEQSLTEDQRRAIEVEVADPRLSVRTVVGRPGRG